jgi:hypothetical protein
VIFDAFLEGYFRYLVTLLVGHPLEKLRLLPVRISHKEHYDPLIHPTTKFAAIIALSFNPKPELYQNLLLP